jgi:hypothetical protein
MFKKFLRLAFLPIIIIILTTATAFVLLQQNIRLSADEEISTLSDNIVSAVEKNRAVLDNQPQDQLVDPTKSDLIFIQAYNDDNSIIFSTLGIDNSNQSKIPQSALDTAKKNNRSNITWSPKKDIRLATIVQRFNGDKPGYIVTGRSLKTFDAKVNSIAKTAAISALASIGVLVLVSAIWAFAESPREKKTKKHHKVDNHTIDKDLIVEEPVTKLAEVKDKIVEAKTKKHTKDKNSTKKK